MHQNRRWRPTVAGGRGPRGRGRAGRAGRCLVFPLGAKLPGLFGCWAACGCGVGPVWTPCAPQAASARAGAASQCGPASAPAVPAWFLPLWPLFGLANPEARWKPNVSPTPSLAPPGLGGHLGGGARTSKHPFLPAGGTNPEFPLASFSVVHFDCLPPPMSTSQGDPRAGPAATIHLLENCSVPCIKTCAPLGPRG